MIIEFLIVFFCVVVPISAVSGLIGGYVENHLVNTGRDSKQALQIGYCITLTLGICLCSLLWAYFRYIH